jgi:hypothetical protein
MLKTHPVPLTHSVPGADSNIYNLRPHRLVWSGQELFKLSAPVQIRLGTLFFEDTGSPLLNPEKSCRIFRKQGINSGSKLRRLKMNEGSVTYAVIVNPVGDAFF